MKYILIVFVSIFSLNYSLGQMKVYAETDKNKNQYNSHLVGIIYPSGEVYKYSNGEEVLWGIVINDCFYIYVNNYSKKNLLGRYSKVPTMGAGGRIYLGTDSGYMAGFRQGGNFYYGDDIEDESSMMGFQVGGSLLHGNEGRFAAAFCLIMFKY
jgi:hypothetical protein